jgi:hypothetical protein
MPIAVLMSVSAVIRLEVRACLDRLVAGASDLMSVSAVIRLEVRACLDQLVAGASKLRILREEIIQVACNECAEQLVVGSLCEFLQRFTQKRALGQVRLKYTP